MSLRNNLKTWIFAVGVGVASGLVASNWSNKSEDYLRY